MAGIPLPFIAKVVGVSFRQDVVTQMQPGQTVQVVHQPDNGFDANACAVLTSSQTLLGYLPRVLAARLAAGTPGGAWEAVIVDVLPGETWGLRVQVLCPQAAVSPAGSAAPVAGPPAAPAPCAVRSKSGRRLGVLVGRDGERVLVRGDSGVEVGYPAALVLVEEPAAV